MKKKYDIHHELRGISILKFEHVKLTPMKIKMLNLIGRLSSTMLKYDSRINITKKVIRGYKNDKLKLTIYEPIDIGEKAPCLLFFHGGAFLTGDFSYMHKIACQYAYAVKCKVIFVHYRLAPKYPFPYGVEDCYASLEWTYAHAGEIGIDPQRIAVCGDSAGGALAAALTHMTRDRGGPSICFQMLIYSVFDSELETESMKTFVDSPGWNSNLNKQMWQYYLRDGDQGMLGYASPMAMESFDGLPDAYIETEEFDCLRDEGIMYAIKLKQFGINVELNSIEGTVHAFDAVQSSVTKEAMRRRIRALRKAFTLNQKCD